MLGSLQLETGIQHLFVLYLSVIDNKQAKLGTDGTRDGMAYPWLDDIAEYLVVAFPISKNIMSALAYVI